MESDERRVAEQGSTYSEPSYAVSSKEFSEYPFYLPNIDKNLHPEMQDLLEKYSKISRGEQSRHVHEIRDRAFSIRAYPCTGLGVFLIPYIRISPAYEEIVTRLKKGDTLLDVGCFIGSDLRRLAFDGAPSQNMTGVDIVSHWEVGHAMFHDEDRFTARFIEADFLSDESSKLVALKCTIDIISISAVLHQWDWNAQVNAVERLISFSKLGSLVVGYQIGNVTAFELVLPSLPVPVWRHTPESFGKMWKMAADATGTEWETRVWLRSFPDVGFDAADSAWMEEGVKVIEFVVTRVK